MTDFSKIHWQPIEGLDQLAGMVDGLLEKSQSPAARFRAVGVPKASMLPPFEPMSGRAGPAYAAV